MTNIYDLSLADDLKIGAIGKVYGAHHTQARQRYESAYLAPKEVNTSGFRIEAISQHNDEHAFTFNRAPSFKFKKEVVSGTTCLLAKDGPFYAAYKFEKPQGRFQAFAGRKFTIPMLDGTSTLAEGQWWHIQHPSSQVTSIAWSTRAKLEQIFLFYNAEVDQSVLTHLVNQYFAEGGLIYASKDYKDLVSMAGRFEDRWRESRYQRKAKRAAISNARKLSVRTSLLEAFIVKQGHLLSNVYGSNGELLNTAIQEKKQALSKRPARFIVSWKA